MKRLQRVFLINLLVVVCAAADFADLNDRWWVRDYFNAVFDSGSEGDCRWTGSFDPPVPGTLCPIWQQRMLDQINFYRTLAGVEAGIVFNPELNRKAQDAALMMALENKISHEPESSWTFYTADGAEAASRSNLAKDLYGTEALLAYIADYGDLNEGVGHRRWLLYPHTREMGNGDIPGEKVGSDWIYSRVNVLWVVPDSSPTRPPTRDEFVAWPPAGYVPAEVVFARWSFSFPGADFSAATVAMRQGSHAVPVRVEPLELKKIGEPTIVWVPKGLDTNSSLHWPAPDADETYHIEISNVRIGGQSRDFTYEVTIFNPAVAGAQEVPTSLSVIAPLVRGQPAALQAQARPWADAIEVRVLAADPQVPLFDAESELLPFINSDQLAYHPINASRRATGQRAFALWHPQPTDQILQLQGRYAVDKPDAALRFASSLAWATVNQVASVEVFLAESGFWQEIWSASGQVGSNLRFDTVEIDLGAFHNQVIELRFVFKVNVIDGKIFYYNAIEDSVGWAFDDVTLAGVSKILDTVLSQTFSIGEPIQLIIPDIDQGYLQAREFAFGNRPLASGPLINLEGLLSGGSPGIVTAPDTWADDPVIGPNYLQGAGDWTFSASLGWVAINRYPWLYTETGWFYHVRGGLATGLWLYNPGRGFVYTRADWAGEFIHQPFGPNDRGSF